MGLVMPLVIVASEKQDDSEKGEVIGSIAFVKNTLQVGANYDDSRVAGFSKDEVALVEQAAGPLANGCEAVLLREQIEDLLDGLLRRFCTEHDQIKPGEIKPIYTAPANFKFRRQHGASADEVVIHSSRRGFLGFSSGEDCEALPVRPQIATTCSIGFGSEVGGAHSASTHQLDEVRDITTIALMHILNRHHSPLLKVQHQAQCVHRWMLCAEALIEFHRLQIGRLTESEVTDLEPRAEPSEPNSLVIDAVLLLLQQQTAIDILPWKKKRTMLGAPLLQKVIEFDPTTNDVTQEVVRCAVTRWKKAGTMLDQMCAAAVTLHAWLGAILWARKDM